MRARAARWCKEVDLLYEEMRCTKQFLKWKAEWWKQRRELPSNIMVDELVREGISAYADRQAALQRQLSDHFSTLWNQAGNGNFYQDMNEVEDNTEHDMVDEIEENTEHDVVDDDEEIEEEMDEEIDENY